MIFEVRLPDLHPITLGEVRNLMRGKAGVRRVLRKKRGCLYKLLEKPRFTPIERSSVRFAGQILPKHFHFGNAPFDSEFRQRLVPVKIRELTLRNARIYPDSPASSACLLEGSSLRCPSLEARPPRPARTPLPRAASRELIRPYDEPPGNPDFPRREGSGAFLHRCGRGILWERRLAWIKVVQRCILASLP